MPQTGPQKQTNLYPHNISVLKKLRKKTLHKYPINKEESAEDNIKTAFVVHL